MTTMENMIANGIWKGKLWSVIELMILILMKKSSSSFRDLSQNANWKLIPELEGSFDDDLLE